MNTKVCTCDTDQTVTCPVHPQRPNTQLFSEPKLLNISKMKLSPANLQRIYLEYANNYTTAALFAEHEGIELWYMELLIDAGRACHHKLRVLPAVEQLYKRER